MEAGKVEKEHHNVIIFGAGASVDAGVPVLNSFVDTMWGYAIRGKSNSGTLDAEQKATLAHAQKIRYELENYSSRAYFDSRNIEDVLSLLSFEALANPGRVDDYKAMVKSIALTIE